MILDKHLLKVELIKAKKQVLLLTTWITLRIRVYLFVFLPIITQFEYES